MRIAVYPGSFDPITKGHEDIIKRASKIFDKVVVGVLYNKEKNCLFSLDERVNLVKKITKEYNNVEVHGFHGLMVDFVNKHNSNVVIKGLRTITDFDYEFQLATLNKSLDKNIETVFMMTDPMYIYISSSAVKQVLSFKGNIEGLVSDLILEDIKIKYYNKEEN